jgi:hypothetical protein
VKIDGSLGRQVQTTSRLVGDHAMGGHTTGGGHMQRYLTKTYPLEDYFLQVTLQEDILREMIL